MKQIVPFLACWFRRVLPVLPLALGCVVAHGAELKTKNVFLITVDGLRWQEMFRGAEELLIDKEHGRVRSTNALRKSFWRDSEEERRAALLPFFWSEVAQKGQIFGNQDKGSTVRVTNGRNFSYPGYSEILVGYPDARIDSNAKIPNANTNVLEWLHLRPEFKGKAAAFGCWDVFPSILNVERAGFPVLAGWDMVDRPNPARESINRVLRAAPREWDSVIYDSFMFYTALDYVREHQPRLLYLAFGETDDWAHDGRYDHYLDAAHRFDQMLRELWTYVQSTPGYKDATSLVITTDHGRGTGPVAWKNHGQALVDSAYIWIAVLGPDTPALGERTNVAELTQSQAASTVAALLDHDYPAAFPKAAPPVPDLTARSRGAAR
jgi:hypothetical protein